MQTIQPLEHGKYYHIYNRGINSDILFKENCNYEHFLKLYDIHIEPIAETYAWCLMKNHSHFLIRIKNLEEINEEKKKLKIGVKIFGRKTPLELSFMQVEKES